MNIKELKSLIDLDWKEDETCFEARPGIYYWKNDKTFSIDIMTSPGNWISKHYMTSERCKQVYNQYKFRNFK